MKALRLFALLAILAGVARATVLERDLGHGLVYLRATALPSDLALEPKAPACVLDLRYATAADDVTPALNAWLNLHTSGSHLVMVLVNGGTAHRVLQALASQSERSGLLTLGPSLPDYQPDIAVPSDATEERQAYDAFARDQDPDKLLSPPSDKTRYDEAAMVKAMHDGEPLPDAEPVPDLEDIKKEPAAPPPLVDHALQRAVQIYRGWQVLAPR